MLLSTLLASKAAIAVGSAVIVLGGGTAAVAAVHVLPAALDHASDVAIGASGSTTGASEPGDDESSSTGSSSSSGSSSESSTSTGSADPAASSSTDRGPDATGPAAFGLCNAYAHGGLPTHSVAYQALARAAAPGTVEEYCATVKHPGGKPAPTTSASSSTKHHGKPSTVPSPGTTHGKSGSHGKPSGAPGRPSTAPAR